MGELHSKRSLRKKGADRRDECFCRELARVSLEQRIGGVGLERIWPRRIMVEGTGGGEPSVTWRRHTPYIFFFSNATFLTSGRQHKSSDGFYPAAHS